MRRVQGASEVAARAADSGPEDPGRPDELDRLPRRYGICLCGTATPALRAFTERARPQISLPRGDGRNAARLADVSSADQSFRVQRQSGSAEDARTTRFRTEAAARRV